MNLDGLMEEIDGGGAGVLYGRCWTKMLQTEEAIRQEVALVVLASTSALLRLPAAEHISPALHVLFLLGRGICWPIWAGHDSGGGGERT